MCASTMSTGVSLQGSVIEIVFLRLIFFAKFLESRTSFMRLPAAGLKSFVRRRGPHKADVSEQQSEAKSSVWKDLEAPIGKYSIGQSVNELRKRDQADAFRQCQPAKDRDQTR